MDAPRPAPKRRTRHGLLFALAAAVALAYILPDLGATGGPLQAAWVAKGGVALIFVSQGLLLSLSNLKQGSVAFRAHALIQGTTYLFYPLLGTLLLALDFDAVPLPLRLGLFYLCALPSTLSSSVALTAAAGGNTALAALNATLSNLLGIVLTPLLVSLAFGTSSDLLPLGDRVRDLALWIFAPFVLGQLLRPWLGALAERRKQQLLGVDQAIVVFLVYTSFCDSIKADLWHKTSWALLLGAGLGALALLFAGMAFVRSCSIRLGFSREDSIAALYCGSHKTLATGVPLASLLFGAHPARGTWLLPLMIYHPVQLVLGAWLAARFSDSNRSKGVE